MSAGDYVFDRVCLLDVPLKTGRLLLPKDIDLKRIPRASEMLLIRTGFEKLRSQRSYIFNGPGVHPDLCALLRERLPKLRALGFDFISLTSFPERELGREAHRIFLKMDSRGHAPWIIEDMHLTKLRKQPQQVIVAPLQVKSADGAPVTILAR